MKNGKELDLGISLSVGGGCDVNDDRVRLEIEDLTSGTNFLLAEFTYFELGQMLSRLHGVKVKGKVQHLDRVGKKQELKDFVFPMPKTTYDDRKAHAIKKAKELCPEGWVPDLYFSSRNNFFQKDGVEYARTTIRRWV